MIYTLIVLSGGQGSRLGGTDKGLLNAGEECFAQHLIRKLAHPNGDVVISANRHLDQYRRFGHCVVSDIRPGFQGPLAGIEAALHAGVSAHRPVLIVPADMPDLPEELPMQLLAAGSPKAVVVAHDGTQQQSLCLSFFPTAWQADLTRFLDDGGRSVRRWLSGKPVVEVTFQGAHAFHNINKPADLNRHAA